MTIFLQVCRLLGMVHISLCGPVHQLPGLPTATGKVTTFHLNHGSHGRPPQQLKTTVRGLLCRSWYFSTSRTALHEALWEVFVALVYRAKFPWHFVRQHSKRFGRCPGCRRVSCCNSPLFCLMWNVLLLALKTPWRRFSLDCSCSKNSCFTEGRLFEAFNPQSHAISL